MSKHTWTDISSVCLSHPLFQKRTTPLLWWACVGPWPPSQAASLWLASSPASAWLTSAQRTVLPSLPARGHQRNTANHLTDTETIQHEYKKTTFGRRTNALFRGPCVSPFTFTLWAQLSLNLHLLSEKVAFLSGTVQQRYRNSCCTAWRPPSVSLSLIVLTWLSLLKCKQLVQVWRLLRREAWFCALTVTCLYRSHSSKLTVGLFDIVKLSVSYQSVSVSYSASCIILTVQDGWAIINF